MFYSIIKRVFDILGGIVGVILLIPVSLVVKVVYLATGDYHSIFLRQDRIGKDGKLFKLYKFRTMVPNADEILMELLKKDKALAKEYKINKKLKKDPRITKAGNVFRRYSIDELPQFLNVLKGDMAIIGNRPYLPREKEDMGDFYKDITKTKPGLTGYWQVNGRSSIAFKERLKLEKYYSLHKSLKLDAEIFLKTFKVVLFGKGAK